MKIVQVHTQAAAGGTQRVSDMVATGLTARGHEMRTVFMYRYSDAYDGVENADILSLERADGLLDKAKGAKALMHYLRRTRPQAVITYDFWGNLIGTAGARMAGVPLVIANQGLAPTQSGTLAVASFLDKLCGSLGGYSYNIVNSTWTDAQYANHPAAYRRRLKLIEHGCWRPDTFLDKVAARDRFHLPQDAKLVISVGRLSDVKNQSVLVAALSHLPDVHLALAGNGPGREDIIRMAQARGLSDRLHLVGEVARSEVYDFLVAGDVFAFPSRSETFGLAAVEAAIAGVPVVASDLPVLRDVLIDEHRQPAALFAKADDAEAFSRALDRLLCQPDLAERIRSSGRSLAQKYDPDQMAARYAALLEGTGAV
ncbi:MAG: glycosyltransferase family 4 protein [Alphaproteobacteria bacterium]|nr:glycosyltransferase family 4 protein [Alphaproteobacteria bacterium]MBU1548516.1 glycosyltransferase family 4 protein [Alphaproteobacteria bacterium]MBU2337712.1 glycosyltransferase family 4 protein [Alphaproteobacteria bacterium]MBU2389849.1 glycosyltransferase family 4 protein [Alphaproteobacteria bacterium]